MTHAAQKQGETPGCVYWVTGLSGAGKTTIATAFYQALKETNRGVVLLDGDELRKSIAEDLGYSRDARIEAAMRYAKISAMLARQGLHVVISTISMFHSVRAWNREHIEHYQEIYLKVPLTILEQRNQKHLYSDAGNGKIKNVMGVDMEIEEPLHPDLIIHNDGRYSVEECVAQIFSLSSRQL